MVYQKKAREIGGLMERTRFESQDPEVYMYIEYIHTYMGLLGFTSQLNERKKNKGHIHTTVIT